MLGSVLKNEQVLQNYARQGRPKNDQGRKKYAKQVLPVLCDPGFWKNCDTVHRVLAPIHEVQYLSEADNYALHKVITTWIKIRVHLIQMSKEHGIEQAVLPNLVKTVWQTRYEKQTQKTHLQAALLVPASHNATIIRYTPKVEFNELMMEFFKAHALGQESSFFRDSLAFKDQRDGFHIDKLCWTYVNDPVTFWDWAADIAPGLAKLAGRLMEVPGNSVLGKQSRLYFTKCLQLLTPYRGKSLVYSKSHPHQNEKWD